MPIDFDYRPVPTDLERLAFNEQPVPGELFTRNPLNKQQAEIYYPDAAADCELKKDHERFLRNDFREVAHDVVVAMRDIEYNSHGWHDKHGHLYYFDSEGEPATRGGPMEPLFFRAQHGQIVNVILRNDLPETVEETEFDLAFPPCPALPWEGECATHVHMVKFDPICGDGASVGWNYMSGARFGKKMVYRWWADRQFGTIFFYDHLFANYRQKHGLFGALIVEPAGSQFFHHIEQQTFGIAEAFTFINQVPFGPGDYLYKLSAADDLWLGCWGFIRALARPEEGGQLDLPTLDKTPLGHTG